MYSGLFFLLHTKTAHTVVEIEIDSREKKSVLWFLVTQTRQRRPISYANEWNGEQSPKRVPYDRWRRVTNRIVSCTYY